MAIKTNVTWPEALRDPSERREGKPRDSGLTMVIDKGLGPNAFSDLLATAGEYIDFIKFGFGTSPLYPLDLLRDKISLAKLSGVAVFPGGTLLESAIRVDAVADYFDMAVELGFDGIEVSDGTIELSRSRRDALIREANQLGLRVFTEYGKKMTGSRIEIDELRRTVESDYQCGAEMVTVEARESGIGVGLYDEKGGCREKELLDLLRLFPGARKLLWEAPLKEQQVALLTLLGSEANLGNISPQEAFSLETLRRGLRSDTFSLHRASSHYMI